MDRSRLESLLAIGRRRAQQLLAPVASGRIGTSLLARRQDLLAHLRRMASGEAAYYERRRSTRLWRQLGLLREQWIEHPPVLVEVSEKALRPVRERDLEGLPAGVELAPGRITVEFSNPGEALEKLVALAVAISHNRDGFDRRVAVSPDTSSRPTLAV